MSQTSSPRTRIPLADGGEPSLRALAAVRWRSTAATTAARLPVTPRLPRDVGVARHPTTSLRKPEGAAVTSSQSGY